MTETAQDFSELAIAEEPGIFWCWRHRKTKTRLRCGRCEKPICPKCTRMGPTGARCLECASNRSQHIYKIAPLQFALTFVVASVLGGLGGLLIGVLRFFVLFFAPMIGTAISKVIIAMTRGKRGTPLAIVASLGTALGAMIPWALEWLPLLLSPSGQATAALFGASALLELAFVLLFLAFAIPAIWYWIK